MLKQRWARHIRKIMIAILHLWVLMQRWLWGIILYGRDCGLIWLYVLRPCERVKPGMRCRKFMNAMCRQISMIGSILLRQMKRYG